MGWQFPPYALILVVGAVALLALAGVGWRKREAVVARRFAYMAGALSFWVGFSALGLLRTDLGSKVLLHRLEITFVPLSMLVIFLFVLEYTGHGEYITRRTLSVLALHPVLVTIALWSGLAPNVMYTRFEVVTVSTRLLGSVFGPYRVLETAFGPGAVFHIGYAYTLVVVSAYLLIRLTLRSQHIYQKQATAVMMAGVVPFAANVVVVLGLNPFPGLGLTEFAFVVTAVLFAWAVFSPEVLDVVPVARESLIEEMHEGVVVIDSSDQVVDINPRAASLFAVDEESVIGAHIADVLPGEFGLFDRFGETEQANEVVDVPTDDGQRHFEVRISPLYDHREELSGRLVIIHDITDRKQYEQELERQNEHLDRFAGVVSHDLRNPLTVGYSALEMAEETGDPEYFEQARNSLDRIDDITDDVLTLAREGQSVTDAEPVDLAAVAEEAWANVETGDATLSVRVDREVPADRRRLLQVFENLVRNAVEHGSTNPDSQARQDSVEHGGESVSVTLGPLPDEPGFFFADDGPGIPADIRDDVFEYGFSGSDGTGFGLAIVQRILEAHGWDITIDDDTGERSDPETRPASGDGGVPIDGEVEDERVAGDEQSAGDERVACDEQSATDRGGTRFEITGLPPE